MHFYFKFELILSHFVCNVDEINLSLNEIREMKKNFKQNDLYNLYLTKYYYNSTGF